MARDAVPTPTLASSATSLMVAMAQRAADSQSRRSLAASNSDTCFGVQRQADRRAARQLGLRIDLHRQRRALRVEPGDLVGAHRFDQAHGGARVVVRRIGRRLSQVLGPDAQHRGLRVDGRLGKGIVADVGAQRRGLEAHARALAPQLAAHEVHARRAEEAGDEHVARLGIDPIGRVELLDLAGAHHGDARGQRHGLDLVVRDVDHGRAQVVVQLLQLAAQFGAQLGIEVGQRLVEQEDLGLAHQRAADRHALALAARELRRLALQQLGQLQHARGVVDALA